MKFNMILPTLCCLLCPEHAICLPDGHGCDLVFTINGPDDLADNFKGDYYSPADKGHPGYKYYWANYLRYDTPSWIADDAWYSVVARKRTPGNNKPEVSSICTKIIDSAGHAVEIAKTVKIHDRYEVETTGTGTGDKHKEREQIARYIFTDNFTSGSVTATSTKSWEFGGSIEGGGDYKIIEYKVGLSAKHNFGAANSKTMNINGKPGEKVIVICYPSYSYKIGTWKRWGVGLEDEGSWRDEYGETMTFTTELDKNEDQ